MSDIIASVWSGHDASFYVADGGIPVVHCELERFIREKEPAGDAIAFMEQMLGSIEHVKHVALIHPERTMHRYEDSYARMLDVVARNEGHIIWVGHHRAHCANAFFSSCFERAVIISFDGGGFEGPEHQTAQTVYLGEGNRITPVSMTPMSVSNIGGLWTRCTRYIFKLNSGWPGGHSAGTVMAMAALGDPSRFKYDFEMMLTTDLLPASMKPAGQPKGDVDLQNEVRHPYLDRWAQIASSNEQDKFDLAAGLQAATEDVIRYVVAQALDAIPGMDSVCLSGGVALNSVAMGKLHDWFPGRRFYVTPTPHDGGLTVGAAQYLWHHVLGKSREQWQGSFSPYLGLEYDVDECIREAMSRDDIVVESASDADIIDMLGGGQIVSVYRGRAESGRRALGNRSILADPRDPGMKERINDRVKHRQWFRPFAPAILREDVASWFQQDIDSPYMSFVASFRPEVVSRVPAAVHVDGTGRLQTVMREENPWFYGLLSIWKERTGVPILINTSFNDREPIVETMEHAIECMLRTEIDAMYVPDAGALIKRRA